MREPWQPIPSQSKRGPGLLALDWAQGARGARLFLASDATQPASELAELRAVSLPDRPPTGLVFAQAGSRASGALGQSTCCAQTSWHARRGLRERAGDTARGRGGRRRAATASAS
jgi:hypothetical protein